MEIQIKSKFDIGQTVKRYKEIAVFGKKRICPICKGNYQVPNPFYDKVEDDEEMLYCNCCDAGYINGEKTFKKVLDDEIYEISSITMTMDKDGKVSFRYGIDSTPKLNSRDSIWISSVADEEELKAVKRPKPNR